MSGVKDADEKLRQVTFNSKAKQKSSILLTLMAKPAFLAALVSIDKFMGILIKPTKSLQSKNEFDILEAYQVMSSVIQVEVKHK